MSQGWQCPLCKTVYAPHVDKCECGKDGMTWNEIKEKYFPNMPDDEPEDRPSKTVVDDPLEWIRDFNERMKRYRPKYDRWVPMYPNPLNPPYKITCGGRFQ